MSAVVEMDISHAVKKISNDLSSFITETPEINILNGTIER